MENAAHLHAAASTARSQAHNDVSRLMPIEPEQIMAEMLPPLALAPSLPCLWDEIRICAFALGCSAVAFVDLAASGQPAGTIVSTFSLQIGPQELRDILGASGGAAILHDSQTLLLPSFGALGLEAALIVRLATPAQDLPRWTPSLAAAFQLGYVRYRQLNPLERAADIALSQREREIMLWVTRGKSNAVIGLILGISAATVDTHMRRIFRKLDVSDRTSAALKAKAIGIIT